MSKRQEFPKKVKLAAWERCKGRCEHCGNKIRPGNGPIYNHKKPDYLGGEPVLENCEVLCERPCNRAQTDKIDRPMIDKARRVLEKRIGVRKGMGFRKKPAGTRYDWTTGRYERTE